MGNYFIKTVVFLFFLIFSLEGFGFWVIAEEPMSQNKCGDFDITMPVNVGFIRVYETNKPDWGKDDVNPLLIIFPPEGYIIDTNSPVSASTNYYNDIDVDAVALLFEDRVEVPVKVDKENRISFINVLGIKLKRHPNYTENLDCKKMRVIKREGEGEDIVDTIIDDIGCFSITSPKVYLVPDETPDEENIITICEGESVIFNVFPADGSKHQVNIQPDFNPQITIFEESGNEVQFDNFGTYIVKGGVIIENCGEDIPRWSKPLTVEVKASPNLELDEDANTSFENGSNTPINLFDYITNYDEKYIYDIKCDCDEEFINKKSETNYEIIPSAIEDIGEYPIIFSAKYNDENACISQKVLKISIWDGVFDLLPSYCYSDVVVNNNGLLELNIDFKGLNYSIYYEFDELILMVNDQDVSEDFLVEDFNKFNKENPKYTFNIIDMFNKLGFNEFEMSFKLAKYSNSSCAKYCNPYSSDYDATACENAKDNYGGCPTSTYYYYNIYKSNIYESADDIGVIEDIEEAKKLEEAYCVAYNKVIYLKGDQEADQEAEDDFTGKLYDDQNVIVDSDYDLDPNDNGTYQFNPFKLTDKLEDFTTEYIDLVITYNYLVGDCEGTSQDTVRIYNEPPSPTVTPLTYCVGDELKPIFTDESIEGATIKWYDGLLDQDGLPQDFLAEGDTILPVIDPYQNGQYAFHVTQTLSGCQSKPATMYITYNALPDVKFKPFSTTKFCNNNEVRDFSNIIPDGYHGNGISTFGYLILESQEIILTDTLENYFFNPSLYPVGEYNLRFEYVANGGCGGIDQEEIEIINSAPVIQFEFADPCDDGQVIFTNTSEIDDDDVVSWKWDFDGQNIHTSNDKNTSFTYSGTGVYPVTLEVETSGACVSSVTKYVSVFPMYELNSDLTYFEHFDDNEHDWVTSAQTHRGANSSWQLMHPVGQFISKERPSDLAFITYSDEESSHNKNEQSWVESPCFIIDDLVAPMLSFKYNMAVQKDVDGAVLQYTVNNGKSWRVLGEMEEGVNWFNARGINTSPGNQSSVDLGWSTEGDSLWYEAKFNLDQIQANLLEQGKGQSIRFRFAFSSDDFTPSDLVVEGFAFDDFFIGERKRVVLVEHFSNIYETTETSKINQYISGQQGVIHINYFMDHPGYENHKKYKSTYSDDPIYLANTAAHSSRALNYNIGDLEQTVVDGIYHQDDPFSAWGEEIIIQQSLSEAPFNIELTAQSNTIHADISAIATINKIDLQNPIRVYGILAQKKFNLGNEAYVHHVMRTILPSTNGQLYTGAWQVDGNFRKESLLMNYNLAELPQGEYMLILYIQDAVSNEVYQTAYLDLDKELQSRINHQNKEQSVMIGNSDYRLFPNPANHQLFIKNNVKQSSLSWRLTALNGIQLQEGVTIDEQIIDISELPAGTYIWSYVMGNHVGQQKIVVMR